jgi:hypothetical protein
VRSAVNCHSNVGFLQADRNVRFKLVRECLSLEQRVANFSVAGNSLKFCDWVQEAYSAPCTFLPNLYYLGDGPCPRHPIYREDTLRVEAARELWHR